MELQGQMTPPSKSVEISITVRFGDTDPYGVVYFASYFRYCHQGIEDFLRHLGFAPENFFKNTQEGFGLPIVDAKCSFLHPVRYGQKLRLAVCLLQTRTKAMTFGFYFYPDEDQTLVARGEATLVAIDRDWKSRAIPENLRDALTAYLPPMHTS